nr:RDD family protein [Microtetraspora sp. NBRC 16547]
MALLAIRRIAATMVDYALVMAYVGALVLIGVSVRAAGFSLTFGIDGFAGRAVAQLAAMAVLTIPATMWLASREASERRATPGKRLLGLAVATRSGETLSRPRAFARSALKLLIPWELAHTAIWNVFTWPGAPSDGLNMVLFALTYLLLIVYAVTLFLGTGRTPYDRLCGSVVSEPARPGGLTARAHPPAGSGR